MNRTGKARCIGLADALNVPTVELCKGRSQAHLIVDVSSGDRSELTEGKALSVHLCEAQSAAKACHAQSAACVSITHTQLQLFVSPSGTRNCSCGVSEPLCARMSLQ